MPSPFDALRSRLLRAGVAPRHVRRYLAELTEHWDDLTAQELRAGHTLIQAKALALNRLGDTDTLAHAMLSKPALRSWSHRAPWAVFAVMPIIVLELMVLLTMTVSAAFVEPHVSQFQPHLSQPGRTPGWPNLIMYALYYFDFWILPVAIGAVVAHLCVKQRLRAGWLVLGAVVACIAFTSTEIRIDVDHGYNVAIRLFPLFQTYGLDVPGPFLRFYALHTLMIVGLMLTPYGLWRSIGARRSARDPSII
jgi:hypothetical protein